MYVCHQRHQRRPGVPARMLDGWVPAQITVSGRDHAMAGFQVIHRNPRKRHALVPKADAPVAQVDGLRRRLSLRGVSMSSTLILFPVRADEPATKAMRHHAFRLDSDAQGCVAWPTVANELGRASGRERVYVLGE